MSPSYPIDAIFWICLAILLMIVISAKKSRIRLADWLNGRSEVTFLVFVVATAGLVISGTLLLLIFAGIISTN